MALRSLVAFAVAATVVAAAESGPAIAAADVEIPAQGIAYAGYYPDAGALAANDFAPIADDITAFNGAGGKASFIGLQLDVADTRAATIGRLNAVRAAGATAVATVNVSATAASIATGGSDGAITTWAGYVKEWLDGTNLDGGLEPSATNRHVIIAPLPAMNATGSAYGCTPSAFESAFNKFVSVTESTLADQAPRVRWAFAPNASSDPGCQSLRSYFDFSAAAKPDLIALGAFNSRGIGAAPDASPSDLFDAALTEVREPTFAPDTPVLLAPTAACPGAHRAGFVKDLFTYAANDANAVAAIWFNAPGACDWRVWDGNTLGDGWSAGVSTAALGNSSTFAPWFVKDTALRVVEPGLAPDPCPPGAACDSVGFVDDVGPLFILKTRIGVVDGAPPPSLVFIYGNPGDFPVMGDWDCDGVVTPGMYRQSDGFVYLKNSNSTGIADIRFFFGNPGDIPIVGDFNGDGCDTVSIYRPSESRVFIINKLGANEGGLGAAEIDYLFGNPGDKPYVGDFDGDGVDTIGLHRESTGLVYFRNSHTQGVADLSFIYGDPGDRLVAGDWNGNGIDTVAVYRPSNGFFYARLSNSAGFADVTFFQSIGLEAVVRAPRGS